MRAVLCAVVLCYVMLCCGERGTCVVLCCVVAGAFQWWIGREREESDRAGEG